MKKKSKNTGSKGNQKQTVKKVYPATWQAISKQAREKVDWRCQHCYKQCYRPGEKAINRLDVLAVHHCNGDTQDNRPDNLLQLCHFCHLRLHNFEQTEKCKYKKKTGVEFKALPVNLQGFFLSQWTQEACNVAIQ